LPPLRFASFYFTLFSFAIFFDAFIDAFPADAVFFLSFLSPLMLRCLIIYFLRHI